MNLIDILLEVQFPDDFSMEEFDSLMTIKERKAYCEKHLKFLGEGSSRIVYDIDDYTVLKMAKNRKGIAQNMIEAEPDFQKYDIMAKIFRADKMHTYIIMEKADKVTGEEFENFTNLKMHELKSYLSNVKKKLRGQNYDKKLVEKYKEDNAGNDFLEETEAAMERFNMSSGDLAKASSWGRVRRDGKYAMVLIDYGLTSAVYQKFYKDHK